MIYVISEKGYVDGERLEGNSYFLEIVYPNLFRKGYAKLYAYAHPNSLSSNHLIDEVKDYSDVEELADIKRFYRILEDPQINMFEEILMKLQKFKEVYKTTDVDKEIELIENKIETLKSLIRET
ncbi:hypothetical protein C4565_00695 [Candidatus Parcubacteria bacterium]|nr:MAG: hypothetical protein C4565_00695 [Candidatus Parcubacteria bacterium]